jgi:acetate kinase
MTGVLVVNAGSSSLKVSVLDGTGNVAAALNLDHWDGSADHRRLRSFLHDQAGVGAIGHRVVHGGSRFTRPTLIDDSVCAGIADCGSVDPGGIGEHQPQVRAEAADGLGFLGVAIDPARNAAAGGDADISAASAQARTLVITARENVEIARQVREVLGWETP